MLERERYAMNMSHEIVTTTIEADVFFPAY